MYDEHDLRLMIKLRSNDQGGVGGLAGVTLAGMDDENADKF